MGCTISKLEQFHSTPTHRQTKDCKIEINENSLQLDQDKIDIEERQIRLIYTPIVTQGQEKKSSSLLDDVVKLSQKCLQQYKRHQIDKAHQILNQVQKFINQISQKKPNLELAKHFSLEFITLSQILAQQYNDMINFNQEILKDGWKIQKDQKTFKVYSRIQGETVGIKLESILDVPFEYFIAVIIQPNHYDEFLPFIVSSKELKNFRRNCKIGAIEMGFPILSNREAYFEGVIYNRLNNKKKQEQQFFAYTRSIHNHPSLQKRYGIDVKLNPKCVQFDYKYLVIKYVPFSNNSGKMTMGINIDLKLNILPMYILEKISLSFSQEFYDNIVKISKKFKGSVWEKGIQNDPHLFQFLKQAKNDYLQKKSS